MSRRSLNKMQAGVSSFEQEQFQRTVSNLASYLLHNGFVFQIGRSPLFWNATRVLLEISLILSFSSVD